MSVLCLARTARLPRGRLVAVVLALCALASAGVRVVASESPEGEAGRTGVIPEGDLAALQDRLAAGRGHPVLLNFWATWCLPCLHEIPLLNDLQGRLGPTGLQLLAISLDSFVFADPAEARRKVSRVITERSFGLPNFLYHGDEQALLEAFDLPAGLPYTILLGPDGSVVDRVEGQLEPAEVERLEAKIESLVSPTKP